MKTKQAAHHVRVPTMSFNGEMKNKEIKKVQFGGWTKRSFKEIRRNIKRRIEKELGIKLR